MTLIKKTTKTLVLGVALLGLAVGASSWETVQTENTWYFNSNNPSEIADATKWTMVDPESTGCDETPADLPCDLNTPLAVNSVSALQSHFSSQYSNNATSIKAAANTQREQP